MEGDQMSMEGEWDLGFPWIPAGVSILIRSPTRGALVDILSLTSPHPREKPSDSIALGLLNLSV